MSKASEKPIYIICAAIWYNDGIKRVHLPRNINTGIVVSGWRHHNCFIQLSQMFPDGDYKNRDEQHTIQGFLTSKGDFLPRNSAALIAYIAGQTETLLKRLTSEDIY